MTELWIKTNNKPIRGNIIIEISNMGRLKRLDGIIYGSKLRQTVKFNGKLTRVYRVIAETFLPNPENKSCVDHKTHKPINMNINDIRNLRWCTHQENDSFPEAIKNKRNAKIGTHPSEETKQRMSESHKRRWQERKKAKDKP